MITENKKYGLMKVKNLDQSRKKKREIEFIDNFTTNFSLFMKSNKKSI